MLSYGPKEDENELVAQDKGWYIVSSAIILTHQPLGGVPVSSCNLEMYFSN